MRCVTPFIFACVGGCFGGGFGGGFVLCVGSTHAHAAMRDETPLVFTQPTYDLLPAPFFPTMVKPRDLDGDGIVDLVVPGRDPEKRLFTMRGVGDGHFVPLQTLVAESFVDWVDLADIDNDGHDDIVAAWRGDFPRLVAYRGLGGGVFAEATVLVGLELGMGRDPQGLAIGDFDGDQDIDIAVTQYVGGAIEVFSNLGNLLFERTDRVRVGSFLGGYQYPRMTFASDIDGDSDLDLIANELGGSRIAVSRNHNGRFARAVEYRVPQIGKERPGIASMMMADVEGDGDSDIVVAALLLAPEQKLVAFINDGTGDFSQRIVGRSSPFGYAFSLEMADFDGDGDLDAATGVALPGMVAVGRRTALGEFDFSIDALLPLGQLIRHISAVDLDGDCDLDIVGVDGPSRAVFSSINNTSAAGCGGGVAATTNARKHVDQSNVTALVTTPALKLITADRNGDGVRDAIDVAVWLASQSTVTPSTTSSTSPTTTPSRTSDHSTSEKRK